MEQDSDATAYASPRSADRMLRILETLAQSDDGRTLAALSKDIDTPKSSVLNLMRALVQNGYVDHAEGYYRLGSGAYSLASAILARRRWPEVALPILERLAEASGETAMLSEIASTKDDFVYIAKAESRQALRFAATVGDRRPLYATAGGLALLANMPLAFVSAYLDRTPLVPLTSHTRTDRAEIETALDEVRRDGYCVTTAGSTLGLSAVAAPVSGSGGLVAAVVLGVPTERFRARSDELIAMTCRTAQEISGVMGRIGDTRAL